MTALHGPFYKVSDGRIGHLIPDIARRAVAAAPRLQPALPAEWIPSPMAVAAT